MRGPVTRLRDTWMRRRELDAVRADVTTAIDELRHDAVAERDSLRTRDGELVGALHRIAEAFERVADGIEAERRDRAAQVDAIELLLRELVLGAAPTARRPTVLGGTIDVGVDALIDIDLADPPIPVDALVEVRSRFHDQWVHGFAVVEFIPGPRRRGYRLRRITDTDQLPLLFDAADIRLAIPAPTEPVPAPLEEPDPSMWR